MREVAIPHGRVRVRESGRGERAIVFAADPPNVLEMYGPLVVAMKPHARVVAFEPVGFAHSKGRARSLDEQADAAVALLDALGLERAVLAFPCVSAFAALRAAQRFPKRVEGIVAIQAPSWDDAKRWLDRVDKRRVLRAPVVGPALGYVRAPQIAKAWYREALPTPEAGAAFGALAVEAFDHGARFPLAQAFRQLEREDAPPATDKPALVVWGAKDRTHARSDPAGFRAHAPRAKLVAFEDAGHFPELEQPKRFAAEVAAWWTE